MSATLVVASADRPSEPGGLRLGRPGSSGDGAGSMEWQLKRNCSISPAQSCGCFAGLCVVSLGIGTLFWWQGAPLVMPFAGLELTLVAALLLLYARHATDRETIQLTSGGWVVERAHGRALARHEFALPSLRVEAGRGSGGLVELSGHGQRVQVGRFVRPELRRQLADELRWASRRWQQAAPGELPAPREARQTMNRRQA